MKPLSLLFVVATLLCATPAGAGEESFEGALARTSSAHPSLYSFADLYRMTVSGAVPGASLASAGEAPVRIATFQPPAQFSVSDGREPNPILLLLSGVMAALWVARRRLGYPL